VLLRVAATDDVQPLLRLSLLGFALAGLVLVLSATALGSPNIRWKRQASEHRSLFSIGWLVGCCCCWLLLIAADCLMAQSSRYLESHRMFVFVGGGTIQARGEEVKPHQLPVELLVRKKGASPQEHFDAICTAIKGSHAGGKVGIFAGEEYTGELCTGMRKTLETAGIAEVDSAGGVGLVMAVKDESELVTIRLASKLSLQICNKVFKNRMLDIIDEEKKVKHEDLAEEMEKWFTNADEEKFGKYAKKLKLSTDELESCYPPIVQSGGNFSLKASANSDDNTLEQGIIMVSLGARCVSIADSPLSLRDVACCAHASLRPFVRRLCFWFWSKLTAARCCVS
jgi:hypothetical protein